MPALLDPPDGWGYPDYEEKQRQRVHEPYTEAEFKFDLWVDDQIDQLREYEMQEAWESGEYDEDEEDDEE